MGVDDATIWWQVYPLGAVGAPVRPWSAGDQADVVHRLGRLLPWVDAAADLGCTGLLLGPVFASSTHGYDTLDHLRVDPRLGDEADLLELVARAHGRGMAVMLDGVFNHVGIDHPLVHAAPGSPEAAMVRRTGDGRAQPWEGHGDLAELDHGDPQVADLVADVMTHWLECGIDGWRLDVAYAVPPAFWREVLGRVRARVPGAFALGEVIHGDYGEIAVAGTLDAVTQYELWKAIWSSLVDENLFELAWAMRRHQEFSERALMQTFVGNHDVSRIASVAGDAGAALAAVVLFTVPGMPSVYAGDEEAFRGVKGSGAEADDALRPELPASPGDLSPAGAWLHEHYRALIALRRAHPWLTRASLEVGEVENLRLTWNCTGEGHELRTEISIDGDPWARVEVDGATAYEWRG